MTANRGLFIRNNGAVGTTPIEARLALAALVAENSTGVPRSGLLDQRAANVVTGSAANMSYDVAPCSPIVNRATGEGVYAFTITGTTNVVTDAAPGTGSRWDLIYVKQNDLDKGDPDNTAIVGVQKGTSGVSPTKPYASLPAGAYVLAEALVSAGAANAADANVTITQVWRYTALRGRPITVRTKAERDEITPAFQTSVTRLDRNNHVQTWNGSAWKWTSSPEQYFTDGTNFTTTATAGSILVGSIPNMPVRSYATQVRVRGQLTLLVGAISTGTKVVRVAVSAAQSTVGNAQGRALTAFTAPGSYYQSQIAQTDWVAVSASAQPLARIWIDNVSGSVNVNATNSPTENWIMAEVLPADD